VLKLFPDKVELSSAPAPGRSVVVVPPAATGIAATADRIGVSPAVPDAGIPFDALGLYVRAQVLDVDATESADLDVGQPLPHQQVDGAASNLQPPAGFINRQQTFGITWGGH
jgi:hypothetical protein